MSPNAVFFGWGRAIPGRERISAQLFPEFVQYLSGLQQAGRIQSFEPVLLNPHGGDLNGFFLIRVESDKLAALMASADWITYMVRSALYLERTGAVPATIGDAIPELLQLWTSLIPG
jgi:hypothetical protein